MSPSLGCRTTTWGTVSSSFREIEIGWDRLGSVGLLAPFLAPAALSRPDIWDHEFVPELSRPFAIHNDNSRGQASDLGNYLGPQTDLLGPVEINPLPLGP
jgi:hypothetical protein